MPTIADTGRLVTGGVDTHAEVHVAGVADQIGRVLGTREFPATAEGYAAALAWMRGHGNLAKVGVEGTGSYGAGLARYLAGQGIEVAEVMRPNRQARRRRGKSDTADAVAAALAALNGEASGQPKSGDGAVESIRALQVARRGAVKACTQAGNQLRDLIVTAPQVLRRSSLACPHRSGSRWLPGSAPAISPARPRRQGRHGHRRPPPPGADHRDRPAGQRAGSASRIRRPGRFPGQKRRGHPSAARLLVTAGDNPGRLRTEASFAALCGASPVDASSGKQLRHRLNRGGDRQANSALWRIAMTRLAPIRAPGPTWPGAPPRARPQKEIIRCLKRYVAREVYKTLTAARQPASTTPKEIP